ncbi:hypothetical protein BU14_0459s0015 [Porphyra umbilicalis]|uniref:4-hydroxy-3-methylbut-2-en-1-yl diphosphate synthase n=1 Tax=Porphyra umbilicalis TaxID=2786 RepID=A0A1X6NU99_PORUM|nr:hypothetical protein BU14_0459s0015 [Porphyra umbilicalis]|eukprot:OSX72194.1 hypothetical protein BU14_0459s0015 [Porphyra umbilicalis]
MAFVTPAVGRAAAVGGRPAPATRLCTRAPRGGVATTATRVVMVAAAEGDAPTNGAPPPASSGTAGIGDGGDGGALPGSSLDLDTTTGAVIRRNTRAVRVGNITIGDGNPVVVQSMINEDTLDIENATASIRALHEIGCEMVRVTCVSMAHAHAVGFIKEKLRAEYQDVPLVADVHHNGMRIAMEVAKHVDKVRINPGLYVFEKPKEGRTEYSTEEFNRLKDKLKTTLTPLVMTLKEQGKAMRIGVNHGSLAERMMFSYGDTPRGMVESAIECIDICRELDFHNLVISMKASKVPVMIAAYRQLALRMDALGYDYPVHVGVTEAGDGDYGRIKSSIGIGTLLGEGIGDTLRVSLTENPMKEIPVCYGILQALNLRRTMTEWVACPSCGRTLFDLEDVLADVRTATKHLDKLDPPISISVLGCIVNGPGEMADADYGYVGSKAGYITLYRRKEVMRTVPQEQGVQALVDLLKADGVWLEPPVEVEVAA